MAPTEDAAAGTETAPDGTALGNPDVTAGNDDSEDEIEAAIRARIELEREKIRREEVEKLAARRAQEDGARAAEATRQQLTQSWSTAVKQSRDLWKSLQVYDKDGNPTALPDELFERIVAQPFQGHNANVQQGVTAALLASIAQQALASLPESVRDDFAAKATGKPFDEWLKLYRETAAPHTEYAAMSQRERDAADKAAAARAKAAVSKPGGTPKQGSERAPNTTNTPDLKTHTGLARALVNGQLTEAEYVKARRQLEGGV